MTWLIYVSPIAILCLYVFWNDRSLAKQPKAAALSPRRWSTADIDRLASSNAHQTEPELPPKTGRRYIVTGGAGFVGGHFVLSLLQRGEDPKHIRVIDVRPPTRRDLTAGPAKEIGFFQADITDPQAVLAAFSAPWPKGTNESEITVFHTVANIRFFERHKVFLPLSSKVNVDGTKNVVDACLSIDASILLYTSSCTVGIHRQRLLLWPWETSSKYPVHVLTDDENSFPKGHEETGSNYIYTKLAADCLVRNADKRPTSTGATLRTGCLRIGNGVFGPGGELFDYTFRNQGSIVFIHDLFASFCYVENAVLAHLCYEQRLVELAHGSINPDIGGQGFMITDPSEATLGRDLYLALGRLSNNVLKFQYISLTLLLLLSHLLEWYSLFRAHFGLLPPLTGDIINLQPSVFDSGYNIFVDDSRARLPAEKGGLGYKAPYTTLQGIHKTWVEYRDNGTLTSLPKGAGFGSAKI